MSDLNKIKKSKKDDCKYIKIYYPNSIKSLLKDLLFKYNYDPIVKVDSSEISSINIKIEEILITNPGKTFYSVFLGLDNPDDF